MKIQSPTGQRIPLRRLPRSQSKPKQEAAQPWAPPPNREARIGRFVRNLTRESLEHLRYLSTMAAFNMVGTTVGFLGFTPLGIGLAHQDAALVSGIAVGGGVFSGGLAALAGFALENQRGGLKLQGKRDGTQMLDTGLAVASGIRALPKFVYPTVLGATPQQQQTIYATLDRLPLKDVTAAASIQVLAGLADSGVSGMAQPGLTQTRLLLDRDYLNSRWGAGPMLVRHEQGHAVDYAGGFGLLGPLNWRGPFGAPPFVSEYASKDRYEDFAESYEQYHQDPARFKADFPQKAAILEQHSQLTPGQRLLDQPTVRQAGRSLGQALGAFPYLRTGLETGLALLSPLQIQRGASALERGYVTGDAALQLQGKMNLVSGVLLGLPGGAPLAVVASALQVGLHAGVDDNPARLQLANQTANAFMALAAGPLGMVTIAIGQELKKAGVDVKKGTTYSLSERGKAVSGGAVLTGLLCTVGGAVAGSLLGVAVGGGAMGVSLSSFWGRIGGGLAGLGLFGAIRAARPEQGPPSAYELTREDKVFLTKIIGGAVAGAALGTAAGVVGGRAVGGLIGTTLLGPAAGSWSADLGGWVGALCGSFTLAKAGAIVGRQRTQGR